MAERDSQRGFHSLPALAGAVQEELNEPEWTGFHCGQERVA